MNAKDLLKIRFEDIPNPADDAHSIGRWWCFGVEEQKGVAGSLTVFDKPGVHTFREPEGEVAKSASDEWIVVAEGIVNSKGLSGPFGPWSCFRVPEGSELVVTVESEVVRLYTAWTPHYRAAAARCISLTNGLCEPIRALFAGGKDLPKAHRLGPFASEAAMAFGLIEHAMGMREFFAHEPAPAS